MQESSLVTCCSYPSCYLCLASPRPTHKVHFPLVRPLELQVPGLPLNANGFQACGLANTRRPPICQDEVLLTQRTFGRREAEGRIPSETHHIQNYLDDRCKVQGFAMATVHGELTLMSLGLMMRTMMQTMAKRTEVDEVKHNIRGVNNWLQTTEDSIKHKAEAKALKERGRP